MQLWVMSTSVNKWGGVMRQLDADQQRPPAFYQNEADLIAIIDHHWRQEDQRWRATDRINRTLVRETTITRLLIAGLLVAYMVENFLV